MLQSDDNEAIDRSEIAWSCRYAVHALIVRRNSRDINGKKTLCIRAGKTFR